jgi:8-oxo-dGTP pyrophosphatase MutT (NUDIX family)
MDYVTPDKVVICITHSDKIFVFHQTQYQDAGIQVPAGTMRAGKNLIIAAIREASEEIKLAKGDPKNRSKSCRNDFHDWDIDDTPYLRRHFFHLTSVGNSPRNGFITKVILQKAHLHR